MKILTIAGTALRRTVRDRTNLFFLFIFPIMLVLVLGAAFGGDFVPKVGVSGPDTDAAQALVTRLEAKDGIEVRVYGSEQAVVDAVERGLVQAGLAIPDDFDDRLSGTDPIDITFVAPPDSFGQDLQVAVGDIVTQESARLKAARYVTSVSGNEFSDVLAAVDEIDAGLEAITVESTVVGESLVPEIGRFDFIAAQEMLLFVFITSLTTSGYLILSRNLGVSRRMLSTPTATRTVVIGETLGRYLIALLQGVFIVAAAWLLFGVRWGDWTATLALLMCFSLVGTAAGMLIGSVFSNDAQAGGIGVMLGMGFGALGGTMIPLEIFPETMQRVAHVTPHAWGMDAFSEIFRGGGVADITTELGVILAMGVGVLAMAIFFFRRSITR